MEALTQRDLWALPIYEGVREQFRREVIAAKKDRRVTVGPFMTFVFENRLTVKFQVMEICRAEKTSAPEAVQHELDGFNEMLPSLNELSATLLVELTGPEAEVAAELTKLTGMGKHTYLEIDGKRLAAHFDGERDDGKRLAAVQYVRFPVPFGVDGAAKFRDPKSKVTLVIDHPNYTHRLELNDAQRASLARDLG
jgi:hypothetical protein